MIDFSFSKPVLTGRVDMGSPSFTGLIVLSLFYKLDGGDCAIIGGVFGGLHQILRHLVHKNMDHVFFHIQLEQGRVQTLANLTPDAEIFYL